MIMAAYPTRNSSDIVIICIGGLLISGIALSLFWKHDLKTSVESNENCTISEVQPENITVSIICTESINRNITLKELQEKSLSRKKRSQKHERKRRRTKTQHGSDNISWNFRLNVTRHENAIPSLSLYDNNKTGNSKENYLEVAVYVQGKGPKQNSEQENALNAVDSFIKNLFGAGISNLSKVMADPKHGATYSITGTLRTESELETLDKSITELKGNETKRTNKSSRNGRFLFNLFRFGEVSSTTEFPKTISESINISPSSGTRTDQNVFRNDKDFSINFDHESTEKNEMIDFKSLISETQTITNADVFVKSKSENLGESYINLQSNKTEESECLDCNFDLEFPMITNTESELKILELTSPHVESLFTDEQLEEFCMDLINRLDKSYEFSPNNSDFVPDMENEINDQMDMLKTTKFDASNLLNSLETKSDSDLNILETSTGNKSSKLIVADSVEQQKRIFEFGIFGSGRSALDENSEINSISNETSDLTEVESLPSALDCISYFKKKQNLKFPKPNLMDMISNPNIKLTDFVNTTMSPGLREEQLQILRDLLKIALDDLSEKSDVKREHIISSNKNSTDDLVVISGNKMETNMEEIETIKSTDISSFNIKKRFENENVEQYTAEIDRDGGLINFGLGSDRPPVESTGRSVRFFLNSVFGSGEGRMLETKNVVEEPNLFRKDSFQEFFSGDDQILDNASEISKETQRRLWGLIGFGSGSERQFNDLELIQAQEVSFNDGGCKNDCSEISNITGRYEDCYKECSLNISIKSDKTNCERECSEFSTFNLTAQYFKSCGDCLHSHEVSGSLCDHCNFEIDSFQVSSTQEIEISKELNRDASELQITLTKSSNSLETDRETENPRFFIRPIFLMGSGNGPINIVEEDFTESDDQAQGNRFRGAQDFDYSNRITSILNEGASSQTEFYESKLKSYEVASKANAEISSSEIPERVGSHTRFSRRGRLLKDDLAGVPGNISKSDEKGMLDDLSDKHIESVVGNVQDLSEFNNITNINETVTSGSFKNDVQKRRVTGLVDVTFSSEAPSKNTSGNVSTEYSHPRFCTSARECNATLNEKCVLKNSQSSTCDCDRKSVRLKENGKCVAKLVITTILKFPAENFTEDLRNPESPKFKETSEFATDTMWELLSDTPHLLQLIADVEVTGFSAGSLIVTWNLILAAEKESEAQLVRSIENNLIKALQNDSLMQKAPLNISQASLLSVDNKQDPCLSKEFNYCNENAKCIRNTDMPRGYDCRCKEGYFDSSKNMYPGEFCEALCPADYCGFHGHCELVENGGRRCSCFEWYFGDRCEISGIVVVLTFSAILFVTILVVFLVVVCRKRCKNGHFQQSEYDAQSRRPGRVSDTIALEEDVGAKISKFVKASTPAQLPAIRVIHPTLTDSSIDSDYDDSTFDTTQNSVKRGMPS